MTLSCLDQSFANARPAAFYLDDTDCKFPDDEGFVRSDGQVEHSCEYSLYDSKLLAPLPIWVWGVLPPNM